MGKCVAKNTRKPDAWNVRGELRIKPCGKLILESGSAIEGLPATPDATTTVKGIVKQAALVAEAAGDAPTAAEFKALLDALKAAGIMAST